MFTNSRMTITGLFRATNVLKHYRGFVMPESERLSGYMNRLVSHPAIRRTCSTEQLYVDSYERHVSVIFCQTSIFSRNDGISGRYAFNRPNTSQR